MTVCPDPAMRGIDLTICLEPMFNALNATMPYTGHVTVALCCLIIISYLIDQDAFIKLMDRAIDSVWASIFVTTGIFFLMMSAVYGVADASTLAGVWAGILAAIFIALMLIREGINYLVMSIRLQDMKTKHEEVQS